MTAPMKECLYLRGWEVGFKKVDFTKLMQEEVSVGLAAAKDLTDRLLAGETVIVWVHHRRATIDRAREIGAIVLDYPRSANAD